MKLKELLQHVDAGRVWCPDLAAVLQHRKREQLYLALGPVALLIDVPKRWQRHTEISVAEIKMKTGKETA